MVLALNIIILVKKVTEPYRFWKQGNYLPRTELYGATAKDMCGTSYPDLFGVGEELLNIPIVNENVEFYDFDLILGEPETAVYANLHNETVSKLILEMINSDISLALRPIGKTNEFGIPLRFNI